MKKKILNLLDGLSESRNRSVSFFVSGSYSFLDRYVVAGSIRMDGADIIGTANRFSPLWNASFKYNVYEEGFMKKISWLDELAFRLSYGLSLIHIWFALLPGCCVCGGRLSVCRTCSSVSRRLVISRCSFRSCILSCWEVSSCRGWRRFI